MDNVIGKDRSGTHASAAPQPTTLCDICSGGFTLSQNYRPCDNCGRNYCGKHLYTEIPKEPPHRPGELRICPACAAAFSAEGNAGLERERHARIPSF